MHAMIPLPSIEVAIRPGTPDDVPFMDKLQKLHSKQVGWMPTAQFEGKVKAGHVLIAEANVDRGLSNVEDQPSRHSTIDDRRSPVGYLIGNDQYFKHDDLGIIYQMNVAPGRQRGLVGATLLQAQFARSAHGCKLYCCWCAQDIAANRFWEAMGFVPLAFRAGSERKSRVHIFWQKRIRQGDTTTPWWFPSQTGGGAIREDRIVLPIPPGTHWSDAKPLILPGMPMPGEATRLDGPKPRRTKAAPPPAAAPARGRATGGLRFAAAAPAPVEAETPKREPKTNTHRVRQKNDPRLVAAARELRDRWLEQVDAGALLPAGKYDVSRAIEARDAAWIEPTTTPLLAA